MKEVDAAIKAVTEGLRSLAQGVEKIAEKLEESAPKKKPAVQRKVGAKPARKTKAKATAESKKATAKKAPAKKVATTAITQKMTKGQIVTSLAESADLTKKQVSEVLDAYENLIARSLKKRGVGEFTLPGLMKVTTKKKPATPKRKGINPFTKEETIFKAKPARNVVKIVPLKRLKEMVS